ncbi:MAG: diguanylate cyclase [Synergistales bacterium]|nr:diguanylate cyclase [Synergistales bacterium]
MADCTVQLNGIDFPGPVLPAAGPNVNDGAQLRAAVQGGAGGIVTKTVSTVPASYPKPCIAKSGDGLLNSETWSERDVRSCLEDYKTARELGVPLVLSIGYSPDEVAELGGLLEREVQPHAIEFSTHYSGTDHTPLLEVARALRGAVACPIWMKLSPALQEPEALAREASAYVDAFVAANSLGPALDFDVEHPVPLLGSDHGQGWLSGPAVLPINLELVYRLAGAQDKPVIGAGGIATGIDAVKYIMAGAHLVQVCTAALRTGPAAYGRIAGEVDQWLDGHGFGSPAEIRGRYPLGPGKGDAPR